MSKIALYSGSFDPITYGHLNIISRAARLFDILVVSVIENPNKKSLFTIDERMEMVKIATSSYNNVNIESFTGLLADYVNDNNFDAIVRGLRNTSDFEYELSMSHINSNLFKGDTENLFIMAEPEFSYISSSAVKEIASFGGQIEQFVPEHVASAVYEKFGRKK